MAAKKTHVQETPSRQGYTALEKAIFRSQAVIEFELDGTIIYANDNFLATMGYRLDEIRGKHHRMFAEKSITDAPEYAMFWQRLSEGEFFSDRVKRINKEGKTVWLQASYNPVFDSRGVPEKVVKFASDITTRVEADELLRDSVENMLKLIESSGQLTLEISSATEELAANSDSQRIQATEISNSTSVILQSLEESDQLGQNARKQATELGQLARSGKEEMNSTLMQITGMSETFGTLMKHVQSLADAGLKIGDTVGLIEDIAENTNVLSLNAAIEAARAGQKGEGFKVVAKEVRKLSEETRQATMEIAEMVGAIREQTNQISEAMKAGNESIDTTVTQADRAKVALESILSGSEQTVSQISSFAKLVDSNSAETQGLANRVQIVSSGIQESASATREVADAIVNLRSVSEQLKQQVESLQ